MQTSLRSLCYFLCVRQERTKPKAFVSLASTPLLVRSRALGAQGFKRAVALWRLRGIGAKALSLDFIKSLVAPGKGGIEIPPLQKDFLFPFLVSLQETGAPRVAGFSKKGKPPRRKRKEIRFIKAIKFPAP